MTNLVALPPGTELVGDYRVERVLGAGGFGITYLATEVPLSRLVTIKEYFPVDFAARDPAEDVCPRSQGSVADYEWGLERFLEEAQTLAKFTHPNIVRVYRYFRARKTGYMVLHFEEGASLKGWLKGLGRAPRQQELDRILVPLLDALEVIHDADFLHRDIAPDNIIIRTDGSPVLIDFGSARGDIAKQTKTLSALVKPGYSPYEQYATTASRQGPWTDIYSLGATLYHAMTGKRPPDAPNRMVADEMVPVREAALSSYRPGFLAAIDKALTLDMPSRPQSIAAWRKELLAPPAGKPGRKPAATRADIEQPPPPPPPVPPPVPPTAKPSPPPPPMPPIPLTLAPQPRPSGPPPARQNGVLGSFMEGWNRALPSGGRADGGIVLPQPPPLAVKPVVAEAPAPAPPAVPRTAAALPPQQLPAVLPKPKAAEPAGRQATPKAIRARSGIRWRPLLAKLAVGACVAAAVAVVQDRFPATIKSEGSGIVLSQSGDTVPLGQLKGHRGVINAIAFTADGRQIVTAAADGTLKIWHAQSRALARTIELEHGAATSMGVEGRRAATGHKDGTVALWDIDSGSRIASFRRNEASVWSVAFAGEPDRVAAAGHDWAVAVWDVRKPAVPVQVLEEHENVAQAVTYAASGGLFATGSADKTVKLWKADGGTLIRTYRGHADFVSALAFTQDGRKLASAGLDGQIRVWSSLSNRLHFTLRGHQARISTLAFAPDGETLASASDDGSVRLWSMRHGRSIRVLQPHTGELKAVAFAPDGKRVALAGADGLVRLYQAAATKLAREGG